MGATISGFYRGAAGSGFLATALALAFNSTCSATIIHVPGNQPTIQAGINAATHGDTVLVADGHYYERITFDGKGIVVASEFLLDSDTLHIQRTIIDGDTSIVPLVADTGSVVRFVNGETLSSVLMGFTIQNGTGTPYSWGAGSYDPCDQCLSGGGVFKAGSSYGAHVNSCTIIRNSAYRGGGVAATNATYYNCTIAENSAVEGGGIACMFGGFTGCTVTGNTGGGVFMIYSSGLRNCNIADNSGYGIFKVTMDVSAERAVNEQMEGASAQIANCVISGNSGPGIDVHTVFYTTTIESCTIAYNGGGIALSRYDAGRYFSVSHCVIVGNEAAYGAGIDPCHYLGHECSSTFGLISDCIFIENHATYGGVIDLGFGCCGGKFQNCTFVNNTADSGSVLYTIGSYPSTAQFDNCISAFNRGGPHIVCRENSEPLFVCSDLYGNEGGDWIGFFADQAGTNGNLSRDPMFCDPAIGDYSIDVLSPCAPESPLNSCDILIGAYPAGCASASDMDSDGIADGMDNCVHDENPGQDDVDGDGIGDVCDNCPSVANTGQDDGDRDGLGDVCDKCPEVWEPHNADSDTDGLGDACDPNGWRVEILRDSDTANAGCQGVSLDFKLYWAEPLAAVTVPVVVRSLDPGAFWAPPLPQDYVPLRGANAQGITWKWPVPGWAGIIQELRPVDGCATPGNLYDGVSPDNFAIIGQGSGCLAPQPDGWVCLTLQFGVTETQGWFVFDTACATPSLPAIYMVDCEGVNHGPVGTNETTFKPGVVKIVSCDCARHCDLNVDGGINPVDVVMIVNCVYRNNCGSIVDNTVCPGTEGDWNCDGRRDPVDVVHYVNFVYRNRTDRPPCNPCACDPYPGDCPPWP